MVAIRMWALALLRANIFLDKDMGAYASYTNLLRSSAVDAFNALSLWTSTFNPKTLDTRVDVSFVPCTLYKCTPTRYYPICGYVNDRCSDYRAYQVFNGDRTYYGPTIRCSVRTYAVRGSFQCDPKYFDRARNALNAGAILNQWRNEMMTTVFGPQVRDFIEYLRQLKDGNFPDPTEALKKLGVVLKP
jgi:hypothetical protein